MIGGDTHSKLVLAESCHTVPHFILTAPQRYQGHVTMANVRRRRAGAAAVLHAVLGPHVPVELERRDGEGELWFHTLWC